MTTTRTDTITTMATCAICGHATDYASAYALDPQCAAEVTTDTDDELLVGDCCHVAHLGDCIDYRLTNE